MHIDLGTKMNNTLLLDWIQILFVEIFKNSCIVFLGPLSSYQYWIVQFLLDKSYYRLTCQQNVIYREVMLLQVNLHFKVT